MNLKCFSISWTFNENPHGCKVFAENFKDAENKVNDKKETEKLTGKIILENCLNPYTLKKDLICYETSWTHNSKEYNCSVFANNLEEALEMLKSKKLTSTVTSETIAEYNSLDLSNPTKVYNEEELKRFRGEN